MERYNHGEVEQKWQKFWEEEKTFQIPDKIEGKENFYQLVEFSYPSGNLHVGHWYAFAVPDIYARYLRMCGKNVLYPMGFDAFGLPAENAAIKRNLNPADWTQDNITYMRKQLRSMGASFDWSREIVTCRPDYYRHTQWLFLQLFKAGLVERKTTTANWCPSCKTVLANEQVVADTCERCNSQIVKKPMLQWQIKITKYADRLIDDLDALDWPEEIKTAQRNWIGRSEGAEIEFKLKSSSLNSNSSKSDLDEDVKVFTTRPDTLFGATYLVLAPEHSIISKIKNEILNYKEVQEYIKSAQKKSEIERMAEGKEKTGVKLEGVMAINPANGEEVPVFVADYVLAHYGTGAIMAVPAHDQRDFEFAQKFGIEIKEVVSPAINIKFEYQFALIESDIQLELEQYNIFWNDIENKHIVKGLNAVEANKVDKILSDKLKIEERFIDSEYCNVGNILENYSNCYTGGGVLINSGKFTGLYSEEAKKKIVEFVEGKMTKTYKLRDWGVSRQRYWGCPIPLVFCKYCAKNTKSKTQNQKEENKEVNAGWFAVGDEQLPVELPEVEDYLPREDGKSPLAKNEEFVATTCPNCGGEAKRETDTLDTFVDSSWYYLRYSDAGNSARFADEQKLEDWLPVDCYSGGAEHTTMHLLYSRFFHKALYDLKLVVQNEPYAKRMNRSLILGPDGKKMSKSKGNVIDPDDLVEKLGADTMRIYLAFIGPYNEVNNYPWNPQAIIGVRRFLERVWKLQASVQVDALQVGDGFAQNDKILHQTLRKVTDSIAQFKFNTGVAALMECVNKLEKTVQITQAQLLLFAQMLYPYAPHLAEEIRENLGEQESFVDKKWPEVDEGLLVEDEITLVVQVAGKVRDKLTVKTGLSDDELEKLALASSKAQKHISDKLVRKIIVVKGRLVNIVV